MLEFHWSGKDISLNEWYSSKHWSKRNKQAKDWHLFFRSMVKAPLPKFEQYTISMEYNSRLDPSNCITLLKLAEDMMQKHGIITNDNKNFCKGISIKPNLEMGKCEYRIIVSEFNNQNQS